MRRVLGRNTVEAGGRNVTQDPRPQLQSLIHNGRSLLESYKQQASSRSAQNTKADLGTSLLAGALGVRRTGWARSVGRAVVQSNAAQRESQFEASFKQWQDTIQAFLGQISVAKATLPIYGNSAELMGRFSSCMKGVTAATRFNQALRFLERLHGQSLVYNGEIAELLKQRQEQKIQDRRMKAELRLMDIPAHAPGFDHLQFPNRAALHERLGAYPEERQMLEGAMDAFLGDGPDRYRQALASARTAMESMAKRITGEEQWRVAIGAVAGNSTKNVFRDVFHFLSARGTHAGKTPTKSEAEFGIQQALSCVIWLINHHQLFLEVDS